MYQKAGVDVCRVFAEAGISVAVRNVSVKRCLMGTGLPDAGTTTTQHRLKPRVGNVPMSLQTMTPLLIASSKGASCRMPLSIAFT